MPEYGAIAYAAAYAAFPTARVTIRVKGGATAIAALCASFGSVRTTGLVTVTGFMDADIMVAQADAFAHADITQ